MTGTSGKATARLPISAVRNVCIQVPWKGTLTVTWWCAIYCSLDNPPFETKLESISDDICTKMNWLIFIVKQRFIPHSYLASVTFSFLMWIERRVSCVVEVRIWSYNTFSNFLSVWGSVLLIDYRKTKHWSWLVPKDDNWQESISFNLFPESQVLSVENKHKSLTEFFCAQKLFFSYQ